MIGEAKQDAANPASLKKSILPVFMAFSCSFHEI